MGRIVLFVMAAVLQPWCQGSRLNNHQERMHVLSPKGGSIQIAGGSSLSELTSPRVQCFCESTNSYKRERRRMASVTQCSDCTHKICKLTFGSTTTWDPECLGSGMFMAAGRSSCYVSYPSCKDSSPSCVPSEGNNTCEQGCALRLRDGEVAPKANTTYRMEGAEAYTGRCLEWTHSLPLELGEQNVILSDELPTWKEVQCAKDECMAGSSSPSPSTASPPHTAPVDPPIMGVTTFTACRCTCNVSVEAALTTGFEGPQIRVRSQHGLMRLINDKGGCGHIEGITDCHDMVEIGEWVVKTGRHLGTSCGGMYTGTAFSEKFNDLLGFAWDRLTNAFAPHPDPNQIIEGGTRLAGNDSKPT